MPTPVGASKIIVIIPTLNEADNIVALIKAYLQLPYSLRLLIADSDSSDGTATLIRQKFNLDPRVTVLDTGAARGRGASIVFAYRWLKTNLPEIEAIATSDADFSHDPADFNRLLTALERTDIVIGSRYSPGSKTVNCAFSRRAFSRFANFSARTLLPVKIHDYTNGYRLFNRRALAALDLNSINADGYIHLSQELLQWFSAGLSITEVPTTFVNRKRGHSNFKLKLVVESFFVLIKLAWQYRFSGSANQHE